ncbi:MAG: diguanylate cyclase [Spirochaetes bacterium]|nr:diguanylate cyclase [Spirochaetota bacterium]HPG51222.1 diguanylate cyclase [Spirochaetota bacterium]
MGLLEKALHYKNDMAGRGQKTIMDRITGPAQTGAPYQEGMVGNSDPILPDDDILYLGSEDLVSVEDEAHEGAEPATPAPTGPLTAESEAGGDDEEAARKPRFTIRPDDGDGAERRETAQPAAGWEESGVLLDNIVLYEMSKDILRAGNTSELFDVILFSIMGQIGVSSASIMLPNYENTEMWEIVESRGVSVNRDELDFSPAAGILRELITNKEIIDVEDYKSDTAFSDDYYTYISIDARLLVPIIFNEEVLGVIILGNKLNSADYTGEEKGFFNVIAEYSAFSYRSIRYKELTETGSGPGSHIVAVDKVRRDIETAGQALRIRDIIRDEFKQLGIEKFAIFALDEASRDYPLFVADAEDSLKLDEHEFRISANSGLVQELSHAESPVIFNDFYRSKTLIEIFTERQLRSMSMSEIFMFKLGGNLLGFIMLFDLAETAHIDTVHARIMKFTDFIFPYISILRGIEYRRGSYIDTIEGVYNRIEDEIRNARDLNIPVSLVLMSIKNYKRFHALFGHEKTKGMFAYFEKFIKTRLSDRDFSVRYDRNKILIVLPGKDKKYAVPLANAICNEMTHAYSSRDVQLLVTFLNAEFPLDGKDSFSLVDAVN